MAVKSGFKIRDVASRSLGAVEVISELFRKPSTAEQVSARQASAGQASAGRALARQVPEGQTRQAPVGQVSEGPERTGRARRAGPFKVPASLATSNDEARRLLANRFRQHLRGVSGARKPGSDPDEYVPPVRAGAARERLGGGRVDLRARARSSWGHLGMKPSVDNDDDE